MVSLSTRQNEILTQAQTNGRVSVEELAARFDVSPQTIRKDLNDLCEARLLMRVHGGAMLASGVENLGYQARRLVAADQKRAIGAAAAALIPDKSSLFITIGTTTEEVARCLTHRSGLLVITNNLTVAAMLYPSTGIDVIVAGGAVRRADGAVIGDTSVELIRQFKVDVAVIGCSAIDDDGALLDFDYREVRVSQEIMTNARKVILVADQLKLERSAPVRIGHIGQIDTFVTDRLLSGPLRARCEAEGVTVIETDSEGEE